MARIGRIVRDGELEICKTIGFERNEVWTKILGRIPRPRKNGDALDAEPESEYILQRLIELYPEILPWDEFQESPKKDEVQVCVVCEGVAAAETDVLLVERTPIGTGRFVVVETKLVKNAEIYRAVVGQVLEYAAKLSTEKLEDLETKASNYWARRPGRFDEKMKEKFSEEWREKIWKTAFENLRRGSLRLLIVGDSIPEELRLAVTFLPSSVLLSSVEVQCHDVSPNDGKVITGVESARTIGVEALQAKLKGYFERIQVSVAQLKMTDSGCIVSEAIGRGKAPSASPIRTYQSHLDGLGGPQTAPGQVLEMLRERALATNGYVSEGTVWLTIRLYNLLGLGAKEEDGRLVVEAWFDGNVVPRSLHEEAIRLYKGTMLREFAKKQTPYAVKFRGITRDLRPAEMERFVHELDNLYRKLAELKASHAVGVHMSQEQADETANIKAEACLAQPEGPDGN